MENSSGGRILKRGGTVINTLDPIEELYDLYSDEEETPRITEMIDKGLDMGDGPANPYMDL